MSIGARFWEPLFRIHSSNPLIALSVGGLL